MMNDFKLNYILSFVITNDLKKISLIKNNIIEIPYFNLCKDKLNGFITEPNINKSNQIVLSNKYFEFFELKTNPNNWRMVLYLQNLQKLWQFAVHSLFLDESMTYNKNLTFYDIKNLPDNCFPYLKWLVPLIIDPLIYNSSFNQIIIN